MAASASPSSASATASRERSAERPNSTFAASVLKPFLRRTSICSSTR